MHTCVYIYIYIYTYTYMCVYIYIYIYDRCPEVSSRYHPFHAYKALFYYY